jgi:hypothetical protein
VFRRLLDEPDAHLHVTGFAEGDVAFVLTRDGLGGLDSQPAVTASGSPVSAEW